MIKRICSVSGQEFIIENEDLDFYAKVGVITEEERDGLKSGKIPEKSVIGLPTLCPEERARRRLSWRNERNLYRRKCNATGKAIISIYHMGNSFPVYDQDYWWSDNWDPFDYGQDFDFSRPFFDQFNELQNKVPRLSIINSKSENSIYTNFSSRNKNCYFTFGMFFDEDVHYCHYGSHCGNCLDSLRISHCELCYECIDCENCYELLYSQNCQNCNTSFFLENCIGCNNCFGCMNLRNKEYYFMNKKYSKNEYEQKIKSLNLEDSTNLKNMRRDFLRFCQKFPYRFMVGTQNENITGNFLYNCRNCTHFFSAGDCEDCKYGYQIDAVNTSYDMNCMGYDKSELCYECTGGTGLFEVVSTECVWTSSDILYSGQCFNSQKLFGCIGLNHKEYCIFNKQYTKEKYENLRKKIIAHMKKTGEWGQFFPISMSPFGYNEAVAQEHFSLLDPKESGLIPNKSGLYQVPDLNFQYTWKEEEQTSKYIGEAYKIPEKIQEVKDEILKKVLICEESGKPFKIQKAELLFYRKMNLPIPRFHPDVRHANRMKLRNPRKLWGRKCGDCQCEIQTTFSPERPEKVLCEKCYLKVVQ